MAKSRKGGKGACIADIKFANSRKSKLFICDKMAGKTVEVVGGINGVLGRRLKKAGFNSAAKLSCKVQRMTKRKYLRYTMKKSGSNVRYAMDSYVSTKNHCDQVKDCKCGRRRRR
ncbi:hypothetical protein NP493_1087g00016 [Ridgeia piscesae]|uniref:Uncharacterized protein n=1 Tax=Ridgeia piscesae TaxID=27915 RepID=A0AAD9NK57_RIDPI|nr:hypothetical protein NP493_1087g00016 [Ridgeia piscesae]